MSDKSVIIIGAGIAGLSAGCYGRMNGFRTRVFEMHTKPGGVCTSWRRQGYVVNGCIHWLGGSSPTAGYYRMWEELGAVQDRNFVYHEEYMRFEGADGKTFMVYTDIDRLEQHMMEIAPEDSAVISEFITAVRRFTRLDIPWEKAPEVSGYIDRMGMIVKLFPFLGKLRKWNGISLREFGARFKNPMIREAFPLLFLPDFPMTFLLMTLAWLHNKAAGYPLGGSLEFARAIERRYLSLGGELNYKSRVNKVLTKNGRAAGIRLEDGTEHRADYVISAADGHATIFNMLEGRYVDDTIKGYYERKKLILNPPLVHVALGVNRTFEEVPHSAFGTYFSLNDPITLGGANVKSIPVHVFNFDPALAPPGKTLLTAMFPVEFEYWEKLKEYPEQYKSEKETIANAVIGLLDKKYPGLALQVEMRDVATPLTLVRYTGNWKASFQGWQITPNTWRVGRTMKKTLPGLDNFFMAGQWVEPAGGVPFVALSGRNAIQIICKQEKKKFVTTTFQ